jgi:hypothetical protein
MKTQNAVLGATLALALVLALMVALQPVPVSIAAPAAAPTPVSGVNYGNSSGVSQLLNFYPGGFKVLTASGRAACFELAQYDVIDLQYAIDVADTQTVTLKLQYTNDRAAYADGLTISNAASEDVSTAIQQYPIFGRDTCIYATLGTANPVTVTLVGVAR